MPKSTQSFQKIQNWPGKDSREVPSVLQSMQSSYEKWRNNKYRWLCLDFSLLIWSLLLFVSFSLPSTESLHCENGDRGQWLIDTEMKDAEGKWLGSGGKGEELVVWWWRLWRDFVCECDRRYCCILWHSESDFEPLRSCPAVVEQKNERGSDENDRRTKGNPVTWIERNRESHHYAKQHFSLKLFVGSNG